MTIPYGYLPAPKGLPELHIEPLVPTARELEWQDWQKKIDAMIWEYTLSVFRLPPELLNDEDIRSGAHRP